ncbi:MAG: zinc ABC transporter substrate-binding protein [Pirellulaceae bacterium]|jgi:zinc transport system substrate-binding protein|nr:zinc ABC transporter substrate-binding protein [Pirellulaceae bacterium]
MHRPHVRLFVVGLCWAIAGCTRSTERLPGDDASGVDDPQLAGAVAVASPLLTAAVRELADETIPLVELAEPGMCPGHFDLRPSQVRRILASRLVLRFDFQKSLDARLTSASAQPPPVAAIQVAGGMCEPTTFTDVCRQVSEALVSHGLIAADEAAARLAGVAQRMEQLDASLQAEVAAAGLSSRRVLASRHQAAFCTRLGLQVVATFPAADIALPSEINGAVQQGEESGVELIIANVPEGRQAADALADRFGARVVVFGNFPDGQGRDSFDRLVRGNVSSLVEAERL